MTRNRRTAEARPHSQEQSVSGPSYLRVTVDPWTIGLVNERRADDLALLIGDPAELQQLDEELLLQIHNAASGTKLRRFPNRSTAVQKTWAAVEELFGSPAAKQRLEAGVALAPEPVRPAASDDRADALRTEITQLRQALAAKTAELRGLAHPDSSIGGESATVARVVELLRRPQGATKSLLAEETGARRGYVDALLNRILPDKGYTIRASAIDDSRKKNYSIPTEG